MHYFANDACTVSGKSGKPRGGEVMPKRRVTKLAPGVTQNVPPGFNTRKMVGDKIKRSVSTIRQWEDKNYIVPDSSMDAGKTHVHLYSDEYVERVVRPLSKSIKPGRPSKVAHAS